MQSSLCLRKLIDDSKFDWFDTSRAMFVHIHQQADKPAPVELTDDLELHFEQEIVQTFLLLHDVPVHVLTVLIFH